MTDFYTSMVVKIRTLRCTYNKSGTNILLPLTKHYHLFHDCEFLSWKKNLYCNHQFLIFLKIKNYYNYILTYCPVNLHWTHCAFGNLYSKRSFLFVRLELARISPVYPPKTNIDDLCTCSKIFLSKSKRKISHYIFKRMLEDMKIL